MDNLRKAAEMALKALDLINQDVQKHRATLPIGRQPELCKASLALRQALAQPEQEPKRWAVFCRSCRKAWSVSYPHPGKSICKDCDDKLAGPVDAVNISQERVDETAKRNCDNCESLRRAAWDRINELEAKLEERELVCCVCGDPKALGIVHSADAPCFHYTKREWVGLTDDEVITILDDNTRDNNGFEIWCNGAGVARAVTAKLKEKNT